MKNQNDLIISIVAIVLALIIAGVCIGTKREPNTIPPPEKVNLTAPALPQGDVVMANALPGGSGSGAGGGNPMGGMGAPMGGGRPMGMGGGPAGRPMGPGGGAGMAGPSTR